MPYVPIQRKVTILRQSFVVSNEELCLGTNANLEIISQKARNDAGAGAAVPDHHDGAMVPMNDFGAADVLGALCHAVIAGDLARFVHYNSDVFGLDSA